MKPTFTIFNLKNVLVLTFVLSIFSSTLSALDLSQAKESGLLGEQANGYLGLVKNPANEELTELAKTVNSKRKAKYQEIAISKDIDIKSVEKQAGIQVIKKTKAGNYINKGNGWQQK